jgi:hypothetical protein
MRLTLRHYHRFERSRPESLRTPAGWDVLRLRGDESFRLPETHEEWERLAERDEVRRRAAELDAWLEARPIESLASYGVGTAALERALWRLRPGRRLLLTESAPATAARLEGLFAEAEVRRHDLRSDPPLDAALHLFHRIDTELDDEEWRDVFSRFSGARVLVVATQVLGPLGLAHALLTRLRPGSTWAGYARTRGAFEALWAATHAAEPFRLYGLEAWALEPR